MVQWGNVSMNVKFVSGLFLNLKKSKILLRLDPSRRRRSFLEKKRKIEKGTEKSAYYDKLVQMKISADISGGSR